MKIDATLRYKHVTVFGDGPGQGNGLIVFFSTVKRSPEDMQRLTQEMRQYESIFLTIDREHSLYTARIFTQSKELLFAGHPILGAAVVLHQLLSSDPKAQWTLQLLGERQVKIDVSHSDGQYLASMQQGKPTFLPPIPLETYSQLLSALNLTPDCLYPGLPLQVVSTGFPYLIIPLISGIDTAKVKQPLDALLAPFDADETYLFDMRTFEGRNFDNGGVLEDIATGSAAGPVAAYLYNHNLLPTEYIRIKQGGFLGRPSKMEVRIKSTDAGIEDIIVSGRVAVIAHGKVEEQNPYAFHQPALGTTPTTAYRPSP